MCYKREVSTDGSKETLPITADAVEASARLSAAIKLQHVVIIIALFAKHPGYV